MAASSDLSPVLGGGPKEWAFKTHKRDIKFKMPGEPPSLLEAVAQRIRDNPVDNPILNARIPRGLDVLPPTRPLSSFIHIDQRPRRNPRSSSTIERGQTWMGN